MELSPRVFFRPEKPGVHWKKGVFAESNRQGDKHRLLAFLNRAIQKEKPGIGMVKLREDGLLVYANGKILSRGHGDWLEKKINGWKSIYKGEKSG